MKEIKTKIQSSGPRTLESAARMPRKVKTAAQKTSDTVQEPDTEMQPEQYATDRAVESTSAIAQRGLGFASTRTLRWVKKRVQALRQPRAEKRDTAYADQPRGQKVNASTVRGTSEPLRGDSLRTSGSQQPSVSYARSVYRRTFKRSASVKSAAEQNSGINTIRKSIKAPSRTVKTARQSIKAGTRAVKTTARTIRTTARTSAQTIRAARATAKAVITGVKLAIKAAIAAVKAIIAATKALVAAIAAGGWVVVVVIIVIAAIAFLLSSPLGIFVNGGADGTSSVSEVVQEINAEFDSRIEQIKRDAGPVDNVRIAFDGDDERTALDNWPDVLAVFAISASLNTENPMDVVVMDGQRKSLLRQIFWDMVSIRYSVSKRVPEPSPQATTTPTDAVSPTAIPVPYRILSITVSTRYWDDEAAAQDFTDSQMQMLEELMSPKGYSMLEALVGSVSGSPATDWSGVIDVPEGGMPIPLYLQGDYTQTVCHIDGAAKSVKTSGCGAASMSMVISYLTGNTNQNPYTLFKWAYDNGYYSGNGLSHGCLSKLAELYGVTGTWIENDADKITEALKAGHPVIAHMGPGIFTSGGHYIVLRGITEDGYVLVNDPGERRKNKYAYPLSIVLAQARTYSSFMVCGKQT